MKNQSSFFYGVFGFQIRKLRLPDELSGTDLTISKATCGNKMLLYLLIRNKYRLKVFKYTIIVNAGNFQSGNIVVSNNKDKAVATAIVFYLYTRRE